MAKYQTTFGFADAPPLGTKGMVLTVKQGDDIIGHLMIGKASLTWFEKNARKQGRKVYWSDFQKWMLTKAPSTASRPKVPE